MKLQGADMTTTHIDNADIHILVDPQALAHQGALLFSEAARTNVAQNGRFAVAISGGATPRAMHRLLAQDPFVDTIPWSNTHIFWIDERMVPENDAASNYGVAKKDFLSRVALPSSNIFPMPPQGPPALAAAEYEETLKRFFADQNPVYPVFDLIFLGMGPDGHVASLFPDQTGKEVTPEWVLAVKGGDPFLDRITLSYPVLNQAKQIVFLVAGRAKAQMVRDIMTAPNLKLPAQKIKPSTNKPLWLLDKEAAHLLPDE
jgi:6-phosphogluconolactonase